ncbi:MAG: hypothetical protein LC131_02335 [Anaerolineae bacterium]|nr:hypothetical protein [Anaerolineae bacterium]
MLDIDLTIDGGGRAQRWLERGVNLESVIDRALGSWANETLDTRMYGEENYVPPPPNSRYIRTGKLGRGWGLMREGRGRVRLFNHVGYAQHVVGDGSGKRQARRMGHWWIGRKRIEERLPRLMVRFRDEIVREMRS